MTSSGSVPHSKPEPIKSKKKATSPNRFDLPEHWQIFFYRVFTLRNCLCAVMVILAFIAWNRGLALMYGMVAMLGSLLFLSVVMPQLYVRRVRIDALSAEPVHVNQEQIINITLAASKTTRCISLLFPHASVNYSIALIEKKIQTLTHRYVPDKRGHWLASYCLAGCRYPLGLLGAQKFIAIKNPGFVTVFPNLFNIKKLPMEWLSGGDSSDAHPHRGRQGDDLFIGIRDYQTGDLYRNIDWRASARTDAIKVREFEPLEQSHFLIVINNDAALNIGEGSRNPFEHGLTIAASLARFAVEQGWRVTIAGACQLQLTSPSQLIDLYHLLAELKPVANTEYNQGLLDSRSNFNRASIVVSFDIAAPVADETLRHQKHWQFLFNRDSYIKPLGNYLKARPEIIGNDVIVPVLGVNTLEGLFDYE